MSWKGFQLILGGQSFSSIWVSIMAPENEFEPLRCDARSNGPARVLATERSGRVEASAPGSVVWVSHAGLLLRCAP